MDHDGFFWKGSLLPLLLLSALLLCKNVTSHPPCPTGVDNCLENLQDFFDSAISRTQNIRVFAIELFTKLTIQYSTEAWYIEDNMKQCHTETINAPDSWEEAKKMSSLELFSVSQLILRSWIFPLIYLTWQSESPTEGYTLINLKTESRKLLKDMDSVVSKVDASIEQKNEYVPWLALAPLQRNSTKTGVIRAVYDVARCMIKDSEKIFNYMRILQCRFSYAESCKPTPINDLQFRVVSVPI